MAGKYHPPTGHNGPDHAKAHDNLLGTLIDNVCYDGEVSHVVTPIYKNDWDEIEEQPK